jgi:hypothetical protein
MNLRVNFPNLEPCYQEYRIRYQERIRMLNGMGHTLEKQLPEFDRRWPNSWV